jgi:hypothetical protein
VDEQETGDRRRGQRDGWMSRRQVVKKERVSRWVDESRRRVAKKERAARWMDEDDQEADS